MDQGLGSQRRFNCLSLGVIVIIATDSGSVVTLNKLLNISLYVCTYIHTCIYA